MRLSHCGQCAITLRLSCVQCVVRCSPGWLVGVGPAGRVSVIHEYLNEEEGLGTPAGRASLLLKSINS